MQLILSFAKKEKAAYDMLMKFEIEQQKTLLAQVQENDRKAKQIMAFHVRRRDIEEYQAMEQLEQQL